VLRALKPQTVLQALRARRNYAPAICSHHWRMKKPRTRRGQRSYCSVTISDYRGLAAPSTDPTHRATPMPSSPYFRQREAPSAFVDNYGDKWECGGCSSKKGPQQ
jgi:hypothetical protein